MKKSFYVLSFITSFTLGIGVLFEFLDWPFRGMIVACGLLLLNFGVIPMFFYQKYKMAI
jgi:hypothetical protein